VHCAESSSEVESSLWAVLRWLGKGAAGKQAPGLFLAHSVTLDKFFCCFVCGSLSDLGK